MAKADRAQFIAWVTGRTTQAEKDMATPDQATISEDQKIADRIRDICDSSGANQDAFREFAQILRGKEGIELPKPLPVPNGYWSKANQIGVAVVPLRCKNSHNYEIGSVCLVKTPNHVHASSICWKSNGYTGNNLQMSCQLDLKLASSTEIEEFLMGLEESVFRKMVVDYTPAMMESEKKAS